MDSPTADHNAVTAETSIFVPQPAHLRLYTHVLETIFGFLSFGELHLVRQVSLQWLASVRCMRPLDSTVCLTARQWRQYGSSVLTTPLARKHINQLGRAVEIEYGTGANMAWVWGNWLCDALTSTS